MICFYCNTELIIGDSIDIDESIHPMLYEEYSVRTNLTCPKCYSDFEVLKKIDAYD
tara:strand:- start:452 stop:619 length:168 start_codon:yes stop_codon:yes gene_type:complete